MQSRAAIIITKLLINNLITNEFLTIKIVDVEPSCCEHLLLLFFASKYASIENMGWEDIEKVDEGSIENQQDVAVVN